jgi:hypothetical protein
MSAPETGQYLATPDLLCREWGERCRRAVEALDALGAPLALEHAQVFADALHLHRRHGMRLLLSQCLCPKDGLVAAHALVIASRHHAPPEAGEEL